MYDKRPAVAIGILTGLLVASQGCQSAPSPVVYDVSGVHITPGADIQGDAKDVQAILAIYKQAEDAVHRKDLDALMALYSDDYKHGGYTKDSVRAVWHDLFERYHDFASLHMFPAIKVEASKAPPIAHVTCTGNLWAVSNETGQRVNIDSWYGEVHHMRLEHGAWHLAGTFWEIPRAKESRPAFLPHPFF